jgi:P-type Cu2+ transporter
MKSTSPAHEHGHAPVPRQKASSAGCHRRPEPLATQGRDEAAAHHRHAAHSGEMFRDRFWIMLLLSIPTLVWSDMIQTWLCFTAPTFPGSAYIPAIFGTAVYLYGR